MYNILCVKFVVLCVWIMAGEKKTKSFFSSSEGGSDRIMVLVYVDEGENYCILMLT